jgi:hypothetical protein
MMCLCMAGDFCMYIHIHIITFYCHLHRRCVIYHDRSRYVTVNSCIILLLQSEGLQHSSHWLFVAVTKSGFSCRPMSITAACVSRTTFAQVITLLRWDILHNEEVDDLFLRTSLSIGGVVTCTWGTETGNAFRLHASKSI